MRASRRARYDGEDKTPTSTRELRGWYSYCIAAEVFAVSGVGSFLPVTLEQLARERGVLRSDNVTSCVLPSSAALHRRGNAPCVITLLGVKVNTSSFALYTFSFAVFVQVITLISISTVADHGATRKRLLLTLGFTGAIACMLFVIVSPAAYLIAPVLVTICVTSLGTTFALLNSFLPLLVQNHPSIVTGDDYPLNQLTIHDETDSDEDRHVEPVQPSYDASAAPESASEALKLSSEISSKCVGLGYAAAVLVQIISIGILVAFSKISPQQSKTTVPMRVVLFLVGIWWAVFTFPTAHWLKARPGPPFPGRTTGTSLRSSWISSIAFAWVSLWKTIKLALKLRQTTIFLAAWFLLSDAIATVSGTAILFARTELQMKTEALAGLSITATVSGIIGAYSWPLIARRFNLKPKSVILLCIILFETIPLYGLLGFLPFVKSWGVGGLQRQWEIFPLGIVLGIVMGGLNSYCRSVFGILIPPNMEAAFYALYAVTDKGSSIIGPTIVGRIVDASGSIRLAFVLLAVLILLPIPLFSLLDVDRGQHDATVLPNNRYTGLLHGRPGDDEFENEGEGLLR